MRYALLAGVVFSIVSSTLVRAQELSDTPSSRAYKLLLEGDQLVAQGRFGDAFERYLTATIFRPYYPEALAQLEKLYEALFDITEKDAADAVSRFARLNALLAHSGSKPLAQASARLEKMYAEMDKAGQANVPGAGLVLWLQPTNIEGLYLSSTYSFIANRTAPNESLNRLIGLELHEDGILQKAKSRFVPGDRPGGETEAELGYSEYLVPSHDATSLVPDRRLAMFYRGESLLRTGRVNEARQDFF